ncbi:MAG: potassium/proton antiporter [Clostridiales bacterium]|nr:potassium/proton antiporter [Clostridiales bacterium]
MTGKILLVAAIILLCLLLTKLSGKIGMPALLAFIVLGMLFGTDGILKIPFDDFRIAEEVCSTALIFIMFYGGFGTNWKQAKPVAVKAVLLSTVGVLLTAALTGVFCYLVLHFSFWEAMLMGAVISSTDAASVFSILRSKHLDLKYNTASLLEVESGSNDPCSYMLTVIILSVMSGEAEGGKLALLIVTQVVFGVLVGIVVAKGTGWLLSKVNFATDGFDTIFVFCSALLAYAGASVLGGNGYLSTYIAGILLGNMSLHNKKSLVHFFDGVNGLAQMLIFFLLGLLAFPSQMPKVLLPAIAIALFLTFVARPVAVFAILTPLKCSVPQQIFVSMAGLRGAASIVFAIMATVSPTYMKNDIFHIVICIVLFSISFQGSLLGMTAKKLDMMDKNANVMKTFSDYSEEVPVEFVKISIKPGHPWENKLVKDIISLPDLLMVLILRGEERLIPNGNTMILLGDKIVMSALSPGEELGLCISEYHVEEDSKMIGKPLAKLKFGEGKLVLLLKRNDKVVIPNGRTVVRKDDVLVISQT